MEKIVSEIKLFVIETYKTIESDMDVNIFKYDKFESTKFRKRLNKELKNDNSLHYKYEDKYECVAYGDIDHCETEEQVINILKYICNMYDVEFSELSYTLSNKKENDNGAHWTIPSIQTNIKSLKIQMKEVRQKFNTNIQYVDNSVYKSWGWLRLPYQTNNNKKTIHRIIQGEPIDFLLHYVENCKFTSYKEEEVFIKPLIKQTFELNYKLLDELSDEFHSGYERWRNMCFFMKNLNYTVDDFINYSKGKDYKNDLECIKMWDSTRLKEGITEAYFYSRLKENKPDIFASFNFKFDYPITKFINEEDIININQRYLIDIETNSNLTDMNDKLTSEIDKFFNTDIKTFSIKSPYDTGKTKLLQRIFNKYQPKKILWLSYRKTLTNDILGSFAESFNFKDYQNKEYNADRLIIQLESLLKLKPNMMFADDEFDIPSYDLVIIDEIESILSHFDSPTFKNQSREVFNWMNEILKVSNKMIVLDGDINDRTYNFINNFGSSINFVNNIKINKRKFFITTQKDSFIKDIINDVNNNKKIVICSMSSKKCSDIYDIIEKECKDKKVLIYTGKTDDRNKLDLKDVNEHWSKCDVLIYSPTIESGVNFDMPYFDKIYGIVCLHSTSQRAFCQMLSRVRKINDSTIKILNVNFNITLNEITENNKYQYDEIKHSLINLDVIKMKELINNGKIKKELELYDSNYVFNKIEILYKNDYYFLGQLKSLVEAKGHQFILDSTEYKPIKKKDDNDLDDEKVDELLKVPDITIIEYDILINKQSDSQATAEDKMKIKKYVFKKCLGVDILNQELIDNYDFSTIKKYIGLIDSHNIIKSTDNKYTEEIKRVEIVQKLINDLGFNNLYDRETFQNKDEFLSRIEHLDNFKDDKSLRILFNCRSIKSNFDSIKSFLGCMNSMLEPYSIKIQSNRKKENQKEVYYYSLNYISGREYIEELLQYRINKGLKVLGNRQYTPTEHYKELIKIKPLVEEVDEDETVYFPHRK
jgi:hypothetical protein